MKLRQWWNHYRQRLGDEATITKDVATLNLERGPIRSRASLRYFGRRVLTSGWIRDDKAEDWFLHELDELIPGRSWTFIRRTDQLNRKSIA